MSVLAKISADGLAHVVCPKPDCGAKLRIKPRSAKSNVTCANCGHKFVLEATSEASPSSPPPPLPTVLAKDTYTFRPDDEPARAKPVRSSKRELSPAERERSYSQRGGRAKSEGRSSPVGLIVGGSIAALLLVGGIIFGAIYFLKDRTPEKRPETPVAQNNTTSPPNTRLTPANAFQEAGNDKKDAAPPSKLKVKPKPKGKSPVINIPKIEPSDPTETTTPVGADKTPKKKNPGKKGNTIAADVLDKIKHSTALIESKGGWGTGFVIAPGLVMTNNHVIAGRMLDELRVSFVSIDDTAPKPLKPKLLYTNKKRDLAILRVDTDRSPLEMCPGGTELEGLAVAIVGNPKGDAGQAQINKVTTGTLASPVRRDAGWTYYELRCEAYFGNSGGPVVDAKTGKLVGVIQSILGDGKFKSYCIPFGEAKRALERLPGREQEPSATRIATARHYLDFIAERLPEIEKNADLAMQGQLANLLYGGGDRVTVTVTTTDGRSFNMSLGELMAELKEKHNATYQSIQKVMPLIAASSEVPSSLRQLLRERIETCGSMRSLAGARTNLETTFRKEMTARKSANDRKAKAFLNAYEKFLDSMDSK